VTRKLSVRVTLLLYLIFLLMYLLKIVCQKFWTPCDVHFEKQTGVYNYAFWTRVRFTVQFISASRPITIAFKIRVLCLC